MSRSRLCIAGAAASGMLISVAACSSNSTSDSSGGGSTSGTSAATQPAGTSSVSTPSSASSTDAAAYPTASSISQPGVLRGAAVGDPKVDVLVNVFYAHGTVTPASGTVTVSNGQRVKVRVTSDSHQNIVVSGQPDKKSDVDPGDPEGIDLTISGSQTVTVTLQPAGVKLVSLRSA